MKEFLMENGMVILVGVIVLIALVSFILKAVKMARLSKQISRDGTETKAVVSRIVVHNDPDTASSTDVYVTYRDETGTEREAILGTMRADSLRKGDEIRILYLPGEHQVVKEKR